MTKGAVALAFLAVIGAPLGARADLLEGVLNITGPVSLSSSGLAFPDQQFFVNSPAFVQQGSFMALAGTEGTIEDITEPVNSLLNVPDFMTFAAAPNISFTLTFLDPGIDGAADCTLIPVAGQVCTPPGSALNMQNTSSSSSTISFGIDGVEVDSLTGDTTPITGQFTLPFANQSFQNLLGVIANGGTVTTVFSAQLSTPPVSEAPEPGMSIALLVGMAMIVGISLAHRTRFGKDESSRRS